MGLMSFTGRVLFASLFILSAYHTYEDQVSHTAIYMLTECPDDEDGILLSATFETTRNIWFHDFGDNGGRATKELAPKVASVHRFLTSKIGKGVPKIDVKNIVIAGMAVKGLGGALFVLGSSTGAYLLMYYLLFTTPILCDFYKYRINEPRFHTLLAEFLQNIALFGALIYFVEMKKLSRRKLSRKKAPKAKTT